MRNSLSDEEIKRQIERAMERGQSHQAPRSAPPPAVMPEKSELPAFLPPEENRHTGFTSYYFRHHQATQATYQLATLGHDVWMGSSEGLIRFQPQTNRWSHYAVPTEIGARGVSKVISAGNRLVVELLHYPQKGYVRSRGAWWFEPVTGRWTRVDPRNHLTPMAWDGKQLWLTSGKKILRLDPVSGKFREFGVSDHPALNQATVAAMLVSGHEAWFCTRGDHQKKSNTFEGGGVFMLHLLSGVWRHYTPSDGLADNYCADIVADPEYIWTAHWHTKTGLSRFHRKQYKWEHLPLASNKTAIGGTKLALAASRVWIGHFNGITWMQKHDLNAYSYPEDQGLPGYIVTGFTSTDDATWAAVHALGARNFHGVRSAGLVRLHHPAIPPRTTAQP